MKKLLSILYIALLGSTSSFADYYKDSLVLDPDTLNQELSSTIADDYIENPLFIYVGVGASYVTNETNVQSDKLVSGAIRKTAGTAELGLGIRFDKNIFATAFMQKAYLSKADITNIGISTNYQFDDTYIGLLGGESKFVWRKSPVKNTLTENKSQKQVFYGFHLGYDYEILYRLSLYTKYQLIYLNHQTNINDDSTIKHNIQNTFTTGVKYAF